jgi:citrate synthase
MESLLDKIERLELEHDKLDPEFVERKRIKLGLRNPDGTGVVAGITTKGSVKGFKRDRHGKNVPIPGKLFYCGYDVEDLVAAAQKEERYGFEETIYLLLTGELPAAEDLKGLSKELGRRRALPKSAREMLSYTSKNDDQMGALHTAISVLHKFDADPRSTAIKDVTRQCVDLIAKFPAIVAFNYHVLRARNGRGQRFVDPDPGEAAAPSFLRMLTGKDPDPKVASIFDCALILHAEHGGGNNSTFTVRTVTSSLTDTYMAISAGVASLAGHLHGGANESVMEMFKGIKKNVKDWGDDAEVSAYLAGLLDRKHGDGSGKIYGMGHAVYTVSDPREPILKEKARGLAAEHGRLDEFALYEKVAALAVKVIKKKKGTNVCPNVDFYSGFVYDMLGIPQELFTPIFAMARVAGWSAHRIEEIIQGRLIRPAYLTTHKKTLKYTPLDER